ncbi:MAG: cyclic nucleotide-binding domain-containing protein [Flammeovirgaceae bacterium]
METPDSEQLNEKVEFLKRVSIFKEVATQSLAAIALVLKEIDTPANTNLFHKGDSGTSMYIIKKGKVSIHDGDYIFNELVEGEVFGEYALLDTESRSASVTTVTATQLLKLEQNDFYWLMNSNAEVMRGIMRVFTQRLRQHNHLEEALAESNVKIKEQHDLIVQENALIERQKEEILAQNEEINAQNTKIEKQNQLLEEWNSKITSSINYAKRIQQVSLPSIQVMEEHFREIFILYLPRDIISGDFYWFTQKDGKALLACADCTGHGVPGALMTMAGTMYLNQAVKEFELSDVAQILNELHDGVAGLLRQKEDSVPDGMDVSLCAIDRYKRTIDFAGAKNSMICVKNGEATVIKGNREPIGGNAYLESRDYKKHFIKADAETTYYLFSDGYQDQFSPAGKKYLKKRFREFLERIHALPLVEQKKILEEEIRNWMGDTEQTDDIMLIGFRV